MKSFIKRLIKLKIDYIFFILIIILFNENTLAKFDTAPPLSDGAVFISRMIIFFCTLIFIICQIFLSKNFILYIRNLFIFLSLFVILDIFFSIIGFGNLFKQNEYLSRRYPSPYDMFSAKPNVKAHNSYGFKGKEFIKNPKKNLVSIAFFGGSTGYNGAPPIVDRLSKLLKEEGIENIFYNFSSTSSNHTQHKHRLLKNLDFKYDIVIFYGGGNETEGYYLYDPRPGFPYNFYYKVMSETRPFMNFLIKNSSFFGEIENRTGYFSGVNKIKVIKNNFKNWSDKIAEQYKKDVAESKKIVQHLVTPNYCNKSSFISVLQPLNFKDSAQIAMVEKIRNKMNKLDFFYDYSFLAKKVTFAMNRKDRIHITNDSKEIVASQLKSDIIKIISKCSN